MRFLADENIPGDAVSSQLRRIRASSGRQLRPASREVVYAVVRTGGSRVAFAFGTSRSIASAAMRQPFGANHVKSCLRSMPYRRKPQERTRFCVDDVDL